MSRWNRSVVKEIVARVSLKDVVEEYVSLQRAGQEYKGLCPFHQEKTPSFYVVEKKGFFYCFGCHQSGDVVRFLELAAGLTRAEAVRQLAQRAGITLDDWSQEEDEAVRHRRALMHACEVAHRLYRRLLRSNAGREARNHLDQRGIAPEAWQRFGLGFGGWNEEELLNALRANDVSPATAEQAGLLVRRRGGGYSPRFLGRLLFPIRNTEGAVVGFSGRALRDGDNIPKYLNSPETAIFRKGDTIFGLYEARREMRRQGLAIMVEGNFDVLSLSAAGVGNVVAPLGTALTSAQVRRLSRLVPKVCLMFDADSAGRKATKKAIAACMQAGMETAVATLPEGEDPDSFARQWGASGIQEAVRQARGWLPYLCEALVHEHEDSPHGLEQAVRELGRIVALDSNRERRSISIREAARLLNLEEWLVERLVGGNAGQQAVVNSQPKTPAWEVTLLELFALDPGFLDRFVEDGDPSWFTDPKAREILELMTESALFCKDGKPDLGARLATSDAGGALRHRVIAAIVDPAAYPADRREKIYAEQFNRLKARAIEAELERKRRLRTEALAKGDVQAAKTLQEEVSSLWRTFVELNERGVGGPVQGQRDGAL